ncbi:deoxyhypusine hydroxylase-like [Babylonia areolata]|uniref:deoxyhypusine hydroxylase-like n=1 Tax=Babylonia areolata TaxID=304850 RepID=UPI003FCF63F5
MTTTQKESIREIGKVLQDKGKPLKDRFRSLFTLKNLGGNEAIDIIASCFDDESALLKHELAYCLGQMQDKYAIPSLITVLEDKTQEPMVRHEAGEALGAIGSPEVLDLLKTYAQDSVVEVAETCQLAVERIAWLQKQRSQEEAGLLPNPYSSVDPAPPASSVDVQALRTSLLDESLPLFQRYRAMFTLRNIGSKDSVLALADGLKCKSALFRHEIAYVLGQIQSDACVSQLRANLIDEHENPMVRHECAEALGSIATDEAVTELQNYLKDSERVVRESCIVALDMSEYENSCQFQYADTLQKMNQEKGAEVTG